MPFIDGITIDSLLQPMQDLRQPLLQLAEIAYLSLIASALFFRPGNEQDSGLVYLLATYLVR